MPLPKKRSTRRRRSQRKVSGPKQVFVLYESGEYLLEESPKFISVFKTREAALEKVKELIKPMNEGIKASAEDPEEAGEFVMENGADGPVAYSESHKGGFYVKELPFEES